MRSHSVPGPLESLALRKPFLYFKKRSLNPLLCAITLNIIFLLFLLRLFCSISCSWKLEQGTFYYLLLGSKFYHGVIKSVGCGKPPSLMEKS